MKVIWIIGYLLISNNALLTVGYGFTLPSSILYILGYMWICSYTLPQRQHDYERKDCGWLYTCVVAFEYHLVGWKFYDYYGKVQQEIGNSLKLIGAAAAADS